MRARGTMQAWAAAVTLGVALAGCSAGSDAQSSASPSTTATTAPTPTATATTPEPTATATTPEPTASSTAQAQPSATPSAEEDTNDPGDGVVRDEPVTVPEPSGDAQATVTPVITRWGVWEDTFTVAAVVDGVVEEDGTCTVTLTRGGSEESATGPATTSANSMNCAEGLAIPLADLRPGVWSATIAYSSADYAGVSAAKDVEVP